MSMSNISNVIISVVFMAFITLMGIITLGLPNRLESDVENRTLAQKPLLNITDIRSGDYFENFDLYFRDQLFKRDYLIKTYTNMQIKLNTTVINGVVMGEDNWLMQSPASLKTKAINESTNNLNSLVTNFTSKNLKFFVALAPHKINIMNDKYPDYIEENKGGENRSYFINSLDSEVHVIELYNFFKKNFTQTELEKMYFKTDHHWNGEAGYQAYKKIITEMMNESVTIDQKSEISFSDYKECNNDSSFMGSYNKKIYGLVAESQNELVCRYVPKDESKLISFEATDRKGKTFKSQDELFGTRMKKNDTTYAGIFSNDVAQIKFKYNTSNQINLLILKDSYANAIVPNIAQHFANTHVIDIRHYEEMDVYEYIKKYDINTVLLLYNDANLFGEMYEFKDGK